MNQGPICELKHYYTNKEEEIRYNIKREEKEISTLTAEQLQNGVVVKVEFVWACDANGTNPYDYYNAKSYADNWEAAKTYLDGLANAVNGLWFQVDLVAVPKA